MRATREENIKKLRYLVKRKYNDEGQPSGDSINSYVVDLLERLVSQYTFQERKEPKTIIKTVSNEIKKGLSSSDFKAVFGLSNKTISTKDLESKCKVGKNTVQRFVEGETKGREHKSLDFMSIYLGFIGWKGFQRNKTIAECFFIKPDDEDFIGFDIEGDTFIDIATVTQEESRDINSDLKIKLFEGSKHFFWELTSKTGRYGHYDIENKDRFIETNILHEKTKKTFSLFNTLKSLWEEDTRHSVLIGEGGMGKTLSFIRWWQFFLNQETTAIPIYISLNEYSTDRIGEENYLINYIAWNYLGLKPLDEITEQQLRKLFVEGTSRKQIDFILFLDGFNEITSDKAALLDDINRNWKTKAWGTQIIISSRYDLRHSYNFSDFHLFEIEPLEGEIIVDYLQKYKVHFSSLSKFQTLLKNPMMLSLYANSAPTIEKYKENPNFHFKPIESQGELLWNYFEVQYIKHFEYYSSDEEKAYFYRFLFKHFLPFIGYEMEKSGKYFVSPKELENILKRTGSVFYSLEFTNAFREYKKYIRHFNIKAKEDVFEEDERIEIFVDIISKELQLLIVENNTLWFQHQNFRDYFASIHIINEIEIQIMEQELPDNLCERVLPVYLQKLIGQIEGEHHYKPTIVEGLGWSIDYKDTFKYDNKVPKTKAIKLLDWCRNRFDKIGIGIATQNLISILNETRGELSGIDLSELNLLESDFNGIRCFKKYHNKYLSANFDGALISENNLFSNGHIGNILSVIYNPDGKRFASAATDNTITEWSVSTKKHIKTYLGHTDGVKKIVYRFDGKTLLSVSWDNTLKEWSTENGECIRTIEDSGGMDTAVYSPDGNHILYGLSNGITKIFSIKENLTKSTDIERWVNVESLSFNKNGDKFISASGALVQEWDTNTLKCINAYDFVKASINNVLYLNSDEDIILCSSSLDSSFGMISFSQKKEVKRFKIGFLSEERILDIAFHNGEEKVIAGTNKGNVYLWELNSEDEEPKQNFPVSKGRINSVSFSPDGQRFVCSPEFNNAEEWSLVTEQPLKYFGSNRINAKAISYSPCGKKFIVGVSNGEIQEWNTENKKCINLYLGHSEGINDVTYSRSGNTILSCSSDKHVKLWSTETSICLHTFKEHKDTSNAVIFSKDGDMFASCSNDKTIRIYLSKDNSIIQVIKDPNFRVFDIRFSPDGKRILSSSLGNILREWLIETGECVQVYEAHKTSIYSCDYSPDGTRIISGSRDFDIKLWETGSSDCLNTIHAQNNGVHYARFSPDGKKILSCGNNPYLHEWVIGEEQSVEDKRKAHTDIIRQVEYSPDGTRVLSCSDDGMVKEWLVEDWLCIETYKIVPGLSINGCTFSDLHKGSEISEDSKDVLRKHNVDID